MSTGEPRNAQPPPGEPGSPGPGSPGHRSARPDPAEPRTLMRWIVGSSLRFRHLVVAAAAGMMVLGITVVPRMHVDVFPEFAPPRVLIQTACVGLSTSDVEQLVTVPLEAAMNGIQGLDDMRSKSVPQLSSIELLRVPGVANVAIWNERLQLMTVQAEPSRMQARGVSLGEVMQTTSDAVDSG